MWKVRSVMLLTFYLNLWGLLSNHDACKEVTTSQTSSNFFRSSHEFVAWKKLACDKKKYDYWKINTRRLALTQWCSVLKPPYWSSPWSQRSPKSSCYHRSNPRSNSARSRWLLVFLRRIIWIHWTSIRRWWSVSMRDDMNHSIHLGCAIVYQWSACMK